MDIKHDIYVISLTHWDREWRFPFQKTRAMLVSMMDGLLDLLDSKPEYQCFHLDGQIIMLEDYCEIRPENKARLKKYVEQGRILIGPWYTLPEENQLHGEALVRNFMYGYRIGREFGGVMDCGYSPTSWGQVSQIPQIMRGFGVRSAIFYRGISGDQVPGHFYNWRSPDGTSIFGIRLGDFARSSFFHLVCRPVIYNRFYGDSIHKWERGGKPLRVSGTGTTTPYHFCNPPFGWHPENMERAVSELYSRDLTDWNNLSFSISMECNDTTGPFPETPRIIEAINKANSGKGKLIHGKLTDFVERAMKEVDPSTMPTLDGEFRNTQRAGVWTDLYPEVQAARMPLKYMNRQSEYRLINYAEPFAAAAWMLGAQYPDKILDLSWKWLLSNHAHDSIGGCSMDLIHYENEFRYTQVNILAENTFLEALLAITGRVDTGNMEPGDQLLYVFNNLPHPRGGAVETEIDYEIEKKVPGIEITDLASGSALPVQELDKTELLVIFQHPCELPNRMKCYRRKITVNVGEIPAFGYKVFRVRPSKEKNAGGTLVTAPNTLENEHLKVTINANGTFNLVNKADGAEYKDQNYFHDQGEIGDPWVGKFPESDKIITSLDCTADIEVVEEGPLSCAIKTTIEMKLPVGCTPDKKKRLAKARPVTISSIIRLKKDERFVRISTTIENTVKDHILRAFFPTGIAADTVQVEMPYDVVSRNIKHPDTTGWREPYRPVQPQRSFVDISDGKRGFAMLNAGNGQYEAVDSPARELALTLLRCHRQWNSARLAEYPDQPGSQLQGTWSFDYALYPHSGDWLTGGVAKQSQIFNLPLRSAVGGPGKGTLPTEKSFLRVEDDRIQLGALKKCEWDDSIVVRLVNPSRQHIKTGVVFGLPVTSAEITDMKEQTVLSPVEVKDNQLSVDLPGGRILTLKLKVTRSV